MVRFALGIPRCVVLVVLAVAGFAYVLVLVTAATVVVAYPLAAVGRIRLAALGRRLARTWGEVDLPVVDRVPPPVPQRRADGWFVHGTSLFAAPAVPRLLLELNHHRKDPAAARESLWLLLTPVTGAVPVLVPPVLLVLGVLLPVRSSWPPWWTVPWGIAAVAVAILLAPAALRAHGRCAQALLATGPISWWRRSPLGHWVTRTSRTTWRLAALAGLSLAAFGGSLLIVLALVISGGWLLPHAAAVTRPMTERYRRNVRRWTGVDLPAPYQPFPAPPALGPDGTYRVGRSLHPDLPWAVRAQRLGWVLRDPATWRELLWSLGSAVLAPTSFVPACLVGAGFYGLVWQPLTWAPWAVPLGLLTGYWISPFYLWTALENVYPAASAVAAWVSLPIGLATSLTGLAAAVPLMRLRLWWDRLLLAPTASAVLAARVTHLTASRADAVDVQAAELRRIERDLHDGAQARLVAVGLGLANVARLLETDPPRARQVLAQAQEASATALTELRDLVRGIHPPVLAERGLGDAIRAIALDTPLPVAVEIDVPERLAAPVESGAYFATCEALANAARSASHVSVSVVHRGDVLRIVVGDDGPGGADPSRGTGLHGIRRRLGTFDGTMTLLSPPGGPTVVTMEIPCASSSPKTSTS